MSQKLLAERVSGKVGAHLEFEKRIKGMVSSAPITKHQAIPVSLLQPHPQHQEDDQLLKAVLVQRTLELRDNEHPKPTLPATFLGSFAHRRATTRVITVDQVRSHFSGLDVRERLIAKLGAV